MGGNFWPEDLSFIYLDETMTSFVVIYMDSICPDFRSPSYVMCKMQRGSSIFIINIGEKVSVLCLANQFQAIVKLSVCPFQSMCVLDFASLRSLMWDRWYIGTRYVVKANWLFNIEETTYLSKSIDDTRYTLHTLGVEQNLLCI